MLKQLFFMLVLVFFLGACEADPDSSELENNSQITNVETIQPTTDIKQQSTESFPDSLQTWSQIKQKGVVRALGLEWEEEGSLPRSGSTSLYHRELLKQFAVEHNLRIEWIKVKDLNQMFDYLAEYKADIIPRHLTITADRKKLMTFTHPLVEDTEVLVTKKRLPASTQDKIANLKNIKVSLPKNTAYIETVKKHFPDWQIDILAGALNSEEIADALADGKIQYSILDGSSVNTLASYRDDIGSVKELPVSRDLAWAVNLDNQSLLDKLNEFIAAHHVARTAMADRTFDLKMLKKNKLPLRMITRNSAETYFLWRGELMGFEYELLREFTKRHKLRLEVIVAETYQEMKSLLKQGKGDLIAAGLSRTEARKPELKFSNRYNRVSEMLVAHKEGNPINSLHDLKGRTISVRKSSAFWTTAQLLAKEYAVDIKQADENMSTELLIAQVAEKIIDLTIADSNLISIEQKFRNNLITPLTLKENVPYAYAVRDNNPQLLNSLNAFIKKEYRGTFYNVVKNKYFGSQKRLKRYRENRISSDSSLSPYDHLVKQSARKFQFDWRLITSQMFQESRFNPDAKSSAGAQGLMQVLPRTAKELGYHNLTQPEQSIAAGVRYLDWTRDRFSTDIPVNEKIYFALAAYNAGYGHVKDAQRLAKTMGLSTDKWFNNVEKSMLLLQKPQYYKKARFGYCRGSEPVNYVRNIHQRYLSYIKITQ